MAVRKLPRKLLSTLPCALPRTLPRTQAGLVLLLLLAVAAPAAAGRIWISPSARVPDDKTLLVTVEGLARGQKATATTESDCGTGEPRQSAQCPALWGPEETPPQGAETSLRFAIAPQKLVRLPRDRVL
jgi:hypothetical protein